MLLNGPAQTEEMAMQFSQFTLLRSVSSVQPRLMIISVASFLGVPLPLIFSELKDVLYMPLFV